MNVFEPILRLFFGRKSVTARVIEAAPQTLVQVLDQKGFSQHNRLSAAIKTVIIQEVLRKAAEQEEDHLARMDPFYDQIELAADNIIAAFNGDVNADPRIKGILVFHKVLPEPNASNARPQSTK